MPSRNVLDATGPLPIDIAFMALMRSFPKKQKMDRGPRKVVIRRGDGKAQSAKETLGA